jgi:nucleotide sugar dehydrogenase
MEKIGVIGLGAIGLPVATFFGLNGFEVIGIDKDQRIVEMVNRKEYVGSEVEVKELLPKSEVRASTNYEDVKDCSLVILTLPSTHNDFSVLEDVVRKLGDINFKNDMIISTTVPPGFTEKLQKKYPDLKLSFVPMRTFERMVIEHFTVFPILIGTFNKETYERIAKYYQACGCETFFCIPPVKAELSKLFSNVYRQVNFGLGNELGIVAKKYGCDPDEIVKFVNEFDYHRNLAKPGMWGGYCLPKDTRMLIEWVRKDHGIELKLVENSEKIRQEAIEERVKEIVSLNPKSVGVIGVTYKPGIPDTRESPAMAVVEKLKERGLIVEIYDKVLGIGSLEKVNSCDAVVTLVDHDKVRE